MPYSRSTEASVGPARFAAHRGVDADTCLSASLRQAPFATLNARTHCRRLSSSALVSSTRSATTTGGQPACDVAFGHLADPEFQVIIAGGGPGTVGLLSLLDPAEVGRQQPAVVGDDVRQPGLGAAEILSRSLHADPHVVERPRDPGQF